MPRLSLKLTRPAGRARSRGRGWRVQLDEALQHRQRLGLLAAAPQHVGALDLRLLRQRRAGGAAFEALVELGGLVVGAGRGLVLASEYNFSGRPVGARRAGRRRRRPAPRWRSRGPRAGPAGWSNASHPWAGGSSTLAREQVMTEERDYRETPSEDEAEREAEGERRAKPSPAARVARPAPRQAAGGDRPEFSRSHLQSLLERGLVSVDGAPARAASRRCARGQRIAVQLVGTEESRAFRPRRWRWRSSTRTSTCW